MEASQPQVLIVDDHLAVRRGMEFVLRDAGFAVAVCPDEPDKARAELIRGDHDVALVEIRRHFGDGVELARTALQAADTAPLVLCTGYAAPRGPLVAASRLGAPGLVLTSSPVATLVQALRTVAGGGSFVDPEVGGPGPAGRRLPGSRDRRAAVSVAGDRADPHPQRHGEAGGADAGAGGRDGGVCAGGGGAGPVARVGPVVFGQGTRRTSTAGLGGAGSGQKRLFAGSFGR
jgi:CheY-like chemotaxis protein